MRFEDADRLPGLDQETLVKIQTPQGLDDAVETIPVARGLADAAVDHQVLRALRHLGVEVVHQHAQRRLGEPAARGDAAAARCAHHARCCGVHLVPSLHRTSGGTMTRMLVAAALALAAAPAVSQDKVNIGISGWTGFAPLTLAVAAGVFRKTAREVPITNNPPDTG